MFCVKCFHPGTKTSNSRPHKKTSSVWRRRHCTHCGHTFTTDERPRTELSIVVNPDSHGSSTSYSLSKLCVSISNAFTHDRHNGALSALDLATTVTTIIGTQHNSPSITPEEISAYTHSVLERFDTKAALQYGLSHGLLAAPTRRR